MINLKSIFVPLVLFLSLTTYPQQEEKKFKYEFSGMTKGDFRYFPEEGLYSEQHQTYFGAAFKPELYMEWAKGTQSIQITGFGRLDQHDNKRTHADVREAFWLMASNKWEISLGVKQIFWGVTESNHQVDIINQRDLLEGNNVENKLGQPMVHLSFTPKWGTLDFMAMSYHRQLEFAGEEGRLRPPLMGVSELVNYEADQEEYNMDFAARWSHSIDVFDIGISHFYGTTRTPIFVSTDGEGKLSQYYELINQSGIDLQASVRSMLFKGEYIYRISERKTIQAFTVGGEYTFSNLFRSGMDIGLLAEYNYDDRGLELITNLDDDFFFGTRVALNDKQSTDMLIGMFVDRKTESQQYSLEFNRRIGNSWKGTVRAFAFNKIPETNFLYLLRKDHNLEISLSHFF